MAIQNSIGLKQTGIISAGGDGTFSGRTITGTTDFIDIADGDGVSENPTASIATNFENTGMHAFNGVFVQKAVTTVTSDGATITLSIEQSGGGDLTVVFSDGYYDYDTTPADTVTLTAGTDTAGQINYVYLLQSTKVLTASTSGWPATECARIATVICQSAATLQTNGAYKHHQWTDDVKEASEQGHITDITYWIRNQPATWVDGVVQTFDITTNAGSADNVILTTTSGNVLQLHVNDFPAFSGTPDIYVVNDSATPFTIVTDLNALLTDSTGASMENSYFSLVIWGAVNQESGDCKLFCNLPSGSYNNPSSLASDSLKYTNYDIPSDFRGVGFLIAEWGLRHQSSANGTWTSISEVDLRGLEPSISPGGSNALPNEFLDSVFRIEDDGDPTKKIAFQASSITTATTRTITMPDKNVNLATATTTNEGIVSELATDAEAIAKSDTSRVLTPSNLAALTPGEAVSGLAEIATQAEVTTGTDDTRFITPLKHVTSLASPPAIGLTASAASAFTTVGIGTTTVPHNSVGVGLLAVEGTDSSVNGPHVQFTTSADDYPLFGLRNYSHDNISMYYDTYWDGTNNRSSDAGSNFVISKNGDKYKILADSGIAQGSIVTLVSIFELVPSGILTLPLQTAFLAYSSSSQTNVTGTVGTGYIQVVFGTEVYDQGSNFSSSTFTVPTSGDGVYDLKTQAYIGGTTAAATQFLIRIVTSNETLVTQSGNIRDTNGNVMLRTSMHTYMDAADTAIVQVRVIGEASDVVDINSQDRYTRFSGVKVC